MIAIYLIATYTVLDNNISRIAIFANPIKKCLEFSKNIRLETIYKYVDIIYIIIDIIKIFVAIAIASSVFSDLFSTVQKETIFNNRYQNINLIIQPFEKGIELSVFGTEFMFISKIETIFTVKFSIYSPFFKIDFSINVVF